MSLLVKILEYIQAGQPVPQEIFSSLNPEEQAAVRSFENSRQIEHRWRDITLSLLRTATDLSRGQDRMKVLDELVHSSRQIIRSDVAYISLNNENTASTSVLTTSGVITEQFRNIRIPFGIGVLGVVASTKQASWTYDHEQDPKVSHVPEVDEAVRAEGIRGILGAPLAIGGEMIGALMVGDRRPRSYTADEIVILDSLASLASVALETSQLIEDLEENITALRDAQEQSEQQIEQLETLSEADSRLMDTLTKGAQLKGVYEIVKEKLGCQVWFWRDGEPFPVHTGERVELEENAEQEMRRLIAESQDTGSITIGEQISVLALTVNQRHLGAICVDRRVSASEARILHRASLTFAAIILFREALVEAESRQVDDLLRRVVAGSAIEEDAARLKKLTGVNLKENVDLHIVVLKSPTPAPSARTLDRLLAKNGLVFEHGDHRCAVVRAPTGIEGTLRVLFDTARQDGRKLYAGATHFPDDPGEIVSAHSRAVSLATSLQGLNLANQVATPSTFGSLGLLLSTEPSTVDQIITDSIGALIAHDEKHSTELTITAAQLFDNSRNISATAKALYVHENTVRQRLERITGILGPHWNTGVRAFDTHLALRAWRIRTQAAPEPKT
ncbi:helix-turn-helix domain-containing protein [Corynebacterium halotolerans]|uniref:Nif-specific regulatory protein n=1 Tax=Corynebacterium halotolerans YIM 70093 = DSM 44683 TaxID=1121362 RepID=M1NNP3_9CORY|nr:helix-turn-helix domain-containing protein [Corynebacterium halotolerans]AGF71107.1 Nif-specific regulatory protein [Corynebacterium halotolerans YIM 70093 = DSM 44683]